MKQLQISGALTACVLVTVVLAGCGGDSDDTPADGTPAAPVATSTSATAQRSATAAPEASPTAPAATPTVPAAQVNSPVPPPTLPAVQPPTVAPPPPPPTAAPPPPPVGGNVSLTIAGINTKFSPSSAIVPAGAVVTMTFNNQDEGITHDLVVFDPAGATLAATDLAEGPIVQTTTFTVGDPGRYSFKCSVHPQDMKGAITVQ
jgi:plastocyanin